MNSSRNEERGVLTRVRTSRPVARLGTPPVRSKDPTSRQARHQATVELLQQGTCSEQLQFPRFLRGRLRYTAPAESEPCRLGQSAPGGVHLTQLAGQPHLTATPRHPLRSRSRSPPRPGPARCLGRRRARSHKAAHGGHEHIGGGERDMAAPLQHRQQESSGRRGHPVPPSSGRRTSSARQGPGSRRPMGLRPSTTGTAMLPGTPRRRSPSKRALGSTSPLRPLSVISKSRADRRDHSGAWRPEQAQGLVRSPSNHSPCPRGARECVGREPTFLGHVADRQRRHPERPRSA